MYVRRFRFRFGMERKRIGARGAGVKLGADPRRGGSRAASTAPSVSRWNVSRPDRPKRDGKAAGRLPGVPNGLRFD